MAVGEENFNLVANLSILEVAFYEPIVDVDISCTFRQQSLK